MDAAYSAKYLPVARLLWNASNGSPRDIPANYAEHLAHTYFDGDISLVPLIDRFDYTEDLEDYDLEDAIELLGRVRPEDWPDLADIESVDVERLLERSGEDEGVAGDIEDFTESEHELSEKVEKVLTHSIESVFGEKIEKVRSGSGKFFDKKNQFGQEPDGSFTGTFEFNGSKFSFQIYPDESGWSVAYRLTPESLDALPPAPPESGKQAVEDRRTHNKGWN